MNAGNNRDSADFLSVAAVKGKLMSDLSRFVLLPIDWNLSPEQAVIMYLEWGNNHWHAEYR